MALTKAKASNILLTTPAASSNDTTPATTAYVTTALANLVDSAPSTLNTLNELAAALGDDANFSTTVTNSIAAKLPLAGGTMTGHLQLNNAVELRSKTTGGTNKTIARINSSDELEYGWSGSGPVKFMGGGAYTERMRIHTDGNIGIGQQNPGQKLDVAGTIQSSVGLRVAGHPVVGYSSITGGYAANLGSTGTSTLNETHIYAGGNQRVVIDGSGYVGINQDDPQALLDIKGDTTTFAGMAKIYLTDTSSNSESRNWSIGNGGSGFGHFTIGLSNAQNGDPQASGTHTNPFVIDHTGKIGMAGNNSPYSQLDLGNPGTARNTTYDVSDRVYIANGSAGSGAQIPLTLGRDDNAATNQEIGLTYNFDDGNWSSTAGVFARVEDASTAWTSLDLRTWGGGWHTPLTITAARNIGIMTTQNQKRNKARVYVGGVLAKEGRWGNGKIGGTTFASVSGTWDFSASTAVTGGFNKIRFTVPDTAGTAGNGYGSYNAIMMLAGYNAPCVVVNFQGYQNQAIYGGRANIIDSNGSTFSCTQGINGSHGFYFEIHCTSTSLTHPNAQIFLSHGGSTTSANIHDLNDCFWTWS